MFVFFVVMVGIDVVKVYVDVFVLGVNLDICWFNNDVEGYLVLVVVF